MGYTISVSFIEFLVYMMKFLIKYYVRKKELLNLKGSKLGQILCADKTGFRRLSYIFSNTSNMTTDIVILSSFNLWNTSNPHFS